MALQRNTSEGQANGTILTAANSGGGSGDAFSTVTSSGTIAYVYSTDNSAFGSTSFKVTPSTSSALYCIASATSTNTGANQMYVYLTGYPSANQLFLNIRTASSNIAAYNINQNGSLVIQNATGSVIYTSPAGIVSLYQWVRLDMYVEIGATTSSGRIVATASYTNSITPFWGMDTGNTTNTGTTNIAEYRFGKLDTTPNIGTFYFDNCAWDAGAAATIPPQTSTVFRNTAEGQANGTPLTAANSGVGSGTAFTDVDTTGSATLSYSNIQHAHGNQSYLMSGGANSTLIIGFDGNTDKIGALQAYYYFTSYPSSNCALMATYTTSFETTLAVGAGGELRTYTNAGGQLDVSPAGIVPLGAWVRFDMLSSIGVSSTSGRLRAKVSLIDNIAPIYTYDSGYTLNLGSGVIDAYLFGKIDSAPSLTTFYADDLAFRSNTENYIPPLSPDSVPSYSPVSWFTA